MTESPEFKNLEGDAFDEAGKLADAKTGHAHTEQIDKAVKAGEKHFGLGEDTAADPQNPQQPGTDQNPDAAQANQQQQ